jgi:uncharacterized protein
MLAVDTNVLVYAHRSDSEFHTAAAHTVRTLAESRSQWAVPWPCLHEFYAIVTHPRIYRPASTVAQALAQLAAWTASPSLVLLGEDTTYLAVLTGLLRSASTTGAAVHDARIAALCLVHGIRELITLDRDFGRFPQLRTTSLLG